MLWGAKFWLLLNIGSLIVHVCTAHENVCIMTHAHEHVDYKDGMMYMYMYILTTAPQKQVYICVRQALGMLWKKGAHCGTVSWLIRAHPICPPAWDNHQSSMPDGFVRRSWSPCRHEARLTLSQRACALNVTPMLYSYLNLFTLWGLFRNHVGNCSVCYRVMFTLMLYVCVLHVSLWVLYCVVLCVCVCVCVRL